MKAPLPERLLWTIYLALNWRGQGRFPYRSPATIARAQSRRVRRMVAHAFNTVPFYRDAMTRAKLTPADFRTAADLAKLPIIDRSNFRTSAKAFESSSSRWGVDLDVHTGGRPVCPGRSNGTPPPSSRARGTANANARSSPASSGGS
jgi:phenylacetate-CoA ligase